MAENNNRPPNNNRDISSSNNYAPNQPTNRSNAKGAHYKNSKDPRNNSMAPMNNRQHASGELDGYNQANRNVYSKSGGSGRNGGPPPRKKKKKTFKRVVIIILILLLLLVTAAGIYIYRGFARINHVATDTSSLIDSAAAAPVVDKDITNILLVGMDKLDGGTRRSDTIMMVSIDNKDNALHVVSFMRDLEVKIPKHGNDKINAAFSLGYADSTGDDAQKTGGGVSLLEATIQNNFGIKTDQYIATDFSKFSSIIDDMGGLDVDLTQAEADSMNELQSGDTGKSTSYVEGTNHLDGEGTLTYGRIREHSSDFARTGRQRDIIAHMIAKFKTLNPGQMASTATNYASNVTTDLSNTQIISLGSQYQTLLAYPQTNLCIPEAADATHADLFTEDPYSVRYRLYMTPAQLQANTSDLQEFLYPTTETTSSTTATTSTKKTGTTTGTTKAASSSK